MGYPTGPFSYSGWNSITSIPVDMVSLARLLALAARVPSRLCCAAGARPSGRLLTRAGTAAWGSDYRSPTASSRQN